MCSKSIIKISTKSVKKSPCQEDRILLVIKVLKKDQISNSKQLYIYIYNISGFILCDQLQGYTV